MRSPSTAQIAEHLRRVPLFAQLNEQAMVELAACCRYRRYDSREALFYEGDEGNTLYMLLSGQVSVQRVNSQGEVRSIALRGPGEHFGELALLDSKPRSADVVTVEPCETLLLDRQAFLSWLESTPSVARNLLSSLAARLREATDLLDEQQSLDAMGRLCARLLELARTYGEAEPDDAVRITLKLTQQELAELIGVDRATVNRILAALRDIGAVQRRAGHLVLTDLACVRRHAQAD